jgi:hypothetical protein
MEEYDDNTLWQLESELHLMWVESDEGREWANKWLQDLAAVEVPTEVYTGSEPVELIEFQGELA